MHRRQDLDTRAKEREVSNLDWADIEHDAVEIEKDSLPQFDIGTIVTEEGWLHPDGITALTKKLYENLTPNFLFQIRGLHSELGRGLVPDRDPELDWALATYTAPDLYFTLKWVAPFGSYRPESFLAHSTTV